MGCAGHPDEHVSVQSDRVSSAKTARSKERNFATQNAIGISLTKLDLVIACELLAFSQP